MSTTWRIFILPAHDLPQGGEAPNLYLTAATTDEGTLAAIETAASEHGVQLERVEAGEQ